MSIDEIAKHLVPGSASCLAISLISGAALLVAGRPGRYAGGALLAATVVTYAAFSTVPVSRALEWGLTRGYRSLLQPSDARAARAIVIIGNGVSSHLHGGRIVHEMKLETAQNVAEGVRLVPLLADPLVIVSGGIADPVAQLRTEADLMREALVRAGVPRDRVIMETVSTNTYEQAREVTVMLRGLRIDRFVVITAPAHMRRVDRLFQRLGLHPTPSLPLTSRVPDGRQLFSLAALSASREAAYEYMALVGYWLQRRI